MAVTWNGWFVVSVLTVAAMGALIWKKKRRSYQKVGYVSKILFFPLKSVPGIEVKEGKCTMLGLEVNGLLDRSFMLVNEDRVYITLKEAPKLAELTSEFSGQNLVISGPGVDPLTIPLERSPNPDDEVIECKLLGEVASVIDCGDNVAKWFGDYLKIPNIRLVRYFPNLPKRKFFLNHPFYQSLRSQYGISLQNLAAFHIMSQSSIDDLNERLGEKKVSELNFRPNILVNGCEPYAEDKWKVMRFGSEVEILNSNPCTRCPLTTYDPETRKLTQKDPLTTLRKYRIPTDKEWLKKLGSRACLGIQCFASKTGTIKLLDDIFAIIE